MRHAIVAVIVSVGCAVPTADPEPGSPPNEGHDQLGDYELVLTPSSRLEGFAFEEMGYKGPFSDDQGRFVITVRTSRSHAQFLAKQWGFEFEGNRRRTDTGDSADVPAIANHGCPHTTSFINDYADIVSELASMDNGSNAIRLYTLGPTATSTNEVFAIEFGPTLPTANPPTVFIFGTHHAREWMSAGTTLGIARWLNDVITTNVDPAMKALLAHTAIVVVPVANPDGYEWSRGVFPNGDRTWRGNRDLSCSRGVDLNRNLTTSHGEPAEGNGACGSDQWPGNTQAAETVALEGLLDGNLGHRIAALVSYHAWGDILIYPAGYKSASDDSGRECGLDVDEQCFNPDFALYRDVFGDTHSGLWVDRESLPPNEFPFFRDHGPALLYGVSGDTGTGVNYSPDFPALSASPEMPGGEWQFRVECEQNPDGLIQSAVDGQKDILRRLAEAAPGLVTSNPGDAWGPHHIGTFASGLMTREYYAEAGTNQETARATFVKSLWAEADPGSAAAVFNGDVHQYRHGRPGAEYNLYYLSCNANEKDFPCFELPCEIISDAGATSTDSSPDCDGVIKLCDPTRLPASGFTLIDDMSSHGGVPDCWWEGSQSGDVLEYPAGVPKEPNTTHCHFTFSMEWDQLSGSIVVERDGERVFQVNPSSPYFFAAAAPRPGRLHSYAFEANAKLPVETQTFQIRIDGTANYVRVYDPVMYCRSGGLP
jgi:hypothetical protein